MAAIREPITLVDWVSTGFTPSDWVSQIAGSQMELVEPADVPEGFVPGGGRCIKLTKADASDRIMFDLSMPAAVDLIDTSVVIEAPVYYPGPFNSEDQTAECGIVIQICSGGSATNKYTKAFYPNDPDPRLGWNSYSYPAQSLNITIGLREVGTPDITAIDYLRVALENAGSSGDESKYAYIGPIRAKRRERTKVMISLDDAKQSVYTKALPIMSPLNIPATISVPASSIGNSGTMTWKQIEELVYTYNWSVASHGLTQANLRTGGLTDAEISAEIINSVREIRAHGYVCDYFVWPGGGYTEYTKTVARNSRIKACFDIIQDFAKAPYGVGISGDYGNYGRIRAEDVGGTVTALEMVDEAIRVGYSCCLFAHDIIDGASGTNTTNVTEWETLMEALAQRRDDGDIDLVTMNAWGADKRLRPTTTFSDDVMGPISRIVGTR